SSVFLLDGPVAPLRPDRSFLVLAPRQSVDLLLFDMLTGTALEWQRVDLTGPAKEVVFDGGAVELTVAIAPGPAATAGAECRIEDVPDHDHWPPGVGAMGPRRFRSTERHGMSTDARAGETLRWLVPARTGVLRLLVDRSEMDRVDLAQAAKGPITLTAKY